MHRWLIKKMSTPVTEQASGSAVAPSTTAANVECTFGTTSDSANEQPRQNPCLQQSQSSQNYDVHVPPDLNMDSLSQPILSNYPKRPFGQTVRCFCASWYQSRPWLEYSILCDASFCFACRKFSMSHSEREDIFTKRGFTNWKKALGKDSGFQKHATSLPHVSSMSAWQEHQRRAERGESISQLLGQTQIDRNRYYVKSIGEAVQFLVVNELALRGHNHEGGEDGLFLKFFDYTLKKDYKLAEIVQHIPDNAKYTSNLIQNEIIETIAKMVLNNIRAKYEKADSPGLCIKSDGTRDRCNIENLSVVIRFVQNSVPKEHLIGLIELDQLDAEYICNQILSHLTELGYRPDNLVCQCYDGASVMSGGRGGVQALLQNKVGKSIPYVHCYNHQLHLAVVHAMETEPLAKKFFDWSNSLNTFCHRHYVAHTYNTPTLKRLLEIRWTSHYEVTKSIVNNENTIRDLLSDVAEDDTAPFDIGTENFFDIGKFLLHVLGALKPANAILQAQAVDLCTAGEVVTASLATLKEMRCDSFWEEHFSQGEKRPNSPPPKRKCKVNSQLGDSIVLSTIGHGDSDDQLAPNQTFKRAMLSILDRAIVEMETRFSQRNVELMRSTSFLLPKSQSFLDPSLLKPLQVLAGIELNSMSLQNEISVAKAMLLNKLPTDANLPEACKCIQQYKVAFPMLHSIYVTALVIGVSSAACKSSFSTLNRILTPLRRTMLHSRKRNLVILAHEKELTENLDMNEFVSEFAKYNRRLVL